MFGIEAGRLTTKFTWPAAVIAAFAPVALAQEAKPPTAAPLEQRVKAFVTQLEAKRKELGVVGAAIVVAQGDRIVRIVGLGQRSAEKPEPVTERSLGLCPSFGAISCLARFGCKARLWRAVGELSRARLRA